MDNEKLYKYIKLAKAGDKDALNQLVDNNIEHIKLVSSKHKTDDNNIDDLIHIGVTGFIKGVITYEEEKKHRFYGVC